MPFHGCSASFWPKAYTLPPPAAAAACTEFQNSMHWKMLNAAACGVGALQLPRSRSRIGSFKQHLSNSHALAHLSSASSPSHMASHCLPSSLIPFSCHFSLSVPKYSSIPIFTHKKSALATNSDHISVCKSLFPTFPREWKPRQSVGSSNDSSLMPFAPIPSQKLDSKICRSVSSWVCKSSILTEASTEAEVPEARGSLSGGGEGGDGGGGGGGGGDSGGAMGWIASATVFAFWAALVLYATLWAPNQTPYRDLYFVLKLSGLKGDDGFLMNPVLVSIWLFMGMWGVIYSMLLLPSGRSERKKTLVWPFAVASFFIGAFALLPYFGLWQPPPPRVSKEELTSWPLNVLESKILSLVLVASGALIAGNAFFASSEKWMEYYQYFRESRFLLLQLSIDFIFFLGAPFGTSGSKKRSTMDQEIFAKARSDNPCFNCMEPGMSQRNARRKGRMLKGLHLRHQIHVMTIDFMTLSSLAPFWIYNDMSVRMWLKKGFWLIPLSTVPVLGPALYLFLRPPVLSINAEKA
ncbi:hypothetical protein O6H91_16G060700 [Diphasiastrum complanatum]|uniref:Uncharacterized protein n=1 Tax=Diphasiastrum complanatum TaxID=34168 RepID=A0ACC2BCN2_DIPCM|nr:hypothetical protein O6H91_16G060700 [Diphasiastrum complanatum]